MITDLLLIIGLAIAIGPLLGVVADRAVDRVRPELELRCTSCQHGMGRKSLVPVLHLFQRCDQCGASVGSRYVAVDALTVLVFVALGLRFDLSIKLLPYLLLGATLVVLSVVDAETHLLPNVIVWPSIWLAIPLTLILSQVIDDSRFVPALVGGLAFGGFIGASHVAYSAGMGRGDVKLALLLGVYVGWASADSLGAIRLVLYSVVLALLGGALLGMAYNAIMKRGRAEIPFGPALAAASLVIIVSSPAILDGIAS